MDVKRRVPGKMLEINVKVGDEVHEKDILGVMEAMKMRQSIACPANGMVKEVRFSVGDRVNAGDVMFVIE